VSISRTASLWIVSALIYGSILSLIPLLRELHFLSAALTALIGSFIAAVFAAGQSRLKPRPASGIRPLLFLLLIAFVPVVPLLITALLLDCFSFEGLSFWMLLPPPSIMLGFAIGRYIRLFTGRPKLYSITVVLLIGLGGLLFELLSYPQVYFYNHVWGFWPGPIYDEQVALPAALLFFRLLTLSWAGLLWLLPSIRLRNNKPGSGNGQRSIRLLSGLLLISLLLGYSNLSSNGIISPPQHLQRSLGEQSRSEHAILYHDASLSEEKLRWIGRQHDFHIRDIAERLEISLDELPLIHSYIYRHKWQKKRLTGAGNTVYVPVWQSKPQLHIQQDALDDILRHELVHVIAREFGIPVLNASPNVALIEGLAVALQEPRNTRATIHQIVAAQQELPDTARMRRLMRPTGFYALSGSLSYNLAGSFVEWLLREYPVDRFKEAYRSGRLESAYQQDFEDLVAGWHAFLQEVEVDEAQLALSNRIFSAPGIAEKSCVFHISAMQRTLSEAGRLTADNADSAAYALLLEYADAHNDPLPDSFLRLFGQHALARGTSGAKIFTSVIEQHNNDDDDAQNFRKRSFTIQLMYIDALFIAEEDRKGERLLQTLVREAGTEDPLPPALQLRSDEITRKQLLLLKYATAEQLATASELQNAEKYPGLNPYRWQTCQRTGLKPASICVQAPDEQSASFTSAAAYQIAEAYLRELLRNGHAELAGQWLSALNKQLKSEAKEEVRNRARLQRLGYLNRILQEENRGN
jgi:hypothetical protein